MQFSSKFLLLLFLLSANLRAANSFPYVILGYPKGNTGCLETAISVGELLHDATGVEIKRAYCEKDKPDAFDIRVLYEAQEELPLVSTEGKMAYAGGYRSVGECQKDLPTQVSLFESRTRLKPFHSYCYIDTSGIERAIGSRIDAFGTPTEWPQVFDDYLDTSPVSLKAIEIELRGALTKSAAIPAIVTITPRDSAIGLDRIIMKYYSPKQVTFRLMQDRFTYKSPAECAEQLDVLKRVLFSQGITTSSSFCTWDNLRTKASINFISTYDALWFRSEIADEKYETFGDCLRKKDQIAEYFKVKLKLPVFGSVCTQSKEFNLSLVKRRYEVELLLPCSKFGEAECFKPPTK